LGFLGFLVFLGFSVLRERTQNNDPEIHEEFMSRFLMYYVNLNIFTRS